jgi:limonene-1,2-epoxide hydrolase
MSDEINPARVVHRLCAATNAHDLDAVVACFATDYRNETPIHPTRGFVGAEQVRRNWTQIFAGIPDVSAEIVRLAVDGDTVWSEWEHRGSRRDGSAHLMRGVILFQVAADRIASARFYFEPVDPEGGTVDDAVRQQLAQRVAP